MKNHTFSIRSVGRRKTSVSTLTITIGGTGQIIVNGSFMEEYFVDVPNRIILVQRPLRIFTPIIDAKITVSGGGKQSQHKSLQLSLARALVLVQPTIRQLFRKNRFLTRDARQKERRKYGLKKARKSSQFSKR